MEWNIKISVFVMLISITCSCMAQKPSFLVKQKQGAILANAASFDDNYQVSYGDNHVTRLDEGKIVQLTIDQSSGAGFQSKVDYLSGFFSMRIKLPPNSDGIITTFYLTNDQEGSQHDELDFEFLGDNILQTNVFVNGEGSREERLHFWFDPSADFHTYKVLWNPSVIMFFVDETPIRIFRNLKRLGIPFPNLPMHIKGSIWTADWAGGPIEWSKGQFPVQYEGFGINGCSSSNGLEECGSSRFAWNKIHRLSSSQLKAYKDIRKKYMFYDYCSDPKRQSKYPEECRGL